ncbi:UDP-sugar pyrophosphorylase 1 [Linum perenne]
MLVREVALPQETTTGTCFLQHYIENVLALLEASCKMTGGRSMVISVEYNQLDPLLRATGYPDGDVNCETGYSPFPGNINQVMDAWVAYAPVKNNSEDASKVPEGNPYHNATSGEMFIYRANSLILKKAGVQVEDPVKEEFNGQEVEVWPRIVWKPKWGLTFIDIKKKVTGTSSISRNSTLALKGSEETCPDDTEKFGG